MDGVWWWDWRGGASITRWVHFCSTMTYAGVWWFWPCMSAFFSLVAIAFQDFRSKRRQRLNRLRDGLNFMRRGIWSQRSAFRFGSVPCPRCARRHGRDRAFDRPVSDPPVAGLWRARCVWHSGRLRADLLQAALRKPDPRDRLHARGLRRLRGRCLCPRQRHGRGVRDVLRRRL